MNSKARMSRLGIVLVVAAFVTAVAVVPRLTSTADEPPSHFDDHIAELEQALAETTAPAARELLEEKLRLAEEDRRLEMEGREALLQPGFEDTVEAAQATTEAEGRLLDMTPAATPPATPAGDGVIGYLQQIPGFKWFYANNMWWRTEENGRMRIVYAGYLTDDREQGAIYVWELGGEVPSENLGQFQTAERHGGLTAVDAEGSVVMLTAEDGATLRFDADALAYVE